MKQACKRLLSLALVLMLVVSLIPANALSVSAAATYEKANSIAVGDTVLLVCENKKMELSGISTTSTKYGLGTAYSGTPAGKWELTVEAGSADGTFSFKAPNGQYLYWGSGNSLTTNATKNANTSWKVSISGGNATITNAKDSGRKLGWNASSPRFACYTSSQTAIQLYKKAAEVADVPCEVNLYENGELTDTLDAVVGKEVELPTVESLAGYAFVGWTTGELDATDVAPTIYKDSFTPEEDCDLYAVYTYEVEGESSTDFELYTGEIVEGDYVILGKGSSNAMSATVASNRLANVTVTVSNNRINNPDASAIWHIVPVNGGYTFYNASKKVYAASNGTKNQATAIASATDKATWTVTGTTARVVENVSNKTAGVNYTLRNNDSYGFACYAASTGAEPVLYKSASTTTVYTTTVDTNCKHTNVETVAEEPATCTAPGATAYTRCADCLIHITDPVEIPALGHNFVAGQVTPPTVLDDGYTTYECSRCDATEKRDIVKAQGVTVSFSVPEGVAAVASMQAARDGITLPAAVAPEGYTFIGWATESIAKTEAKPTVAAAGATYKTEEAITLYAVFSKSVGNGWVKVEDTSVLEAGKQVVIVSADGKKAMSTTQNSNNRGSTNFDVNNVVAPVQILVLENGTQSGSFAFKADTGYLYAASTGSNYLRTKTTKDASGSFTITIDAKGVATVKSVGNTSRGWIRYNSSNNPPIFSCYGNGQSDIYLYILDGTTYYMSELACEHKYEEEVTVDPTCEDEGELTYTCIYCGDSYTESIDANGHDYDDGAITQTPTCNDAGVRTYTCYECGDTYTEVVNALGHTPVDVPGYAADCENDGLTDGVKCGVCGEWITAQTVIPAKGHNKVDKPGYAADCENDGLTDGVYCDVCNTWVVPQTVIPAKGHTYTTYIYNEDATVYADGTETAACDNGCGTTHTRTAEGTKLTAVAKNGEKLYTTLAAAVAEAEAGATVELLCSTSGKGMVISKNLTIDFGGYTYSLTEGVGSTGTASNGLQILAGNEVNLKNGTLEVAAEAADKFYILVQNYADLTVIDMTLDGTNLDKWAFTDGDSYTLSNNSGAVNILGATNIIANNDGDLAFAFDVCDNKYYASKPVVNVNTTGTITGAIEVSATISENLNILGGTFTVPVEEAWCAGGFIPTVNADGTYGVKAGKYVAMANGQKFETLAEAVAAAEDGSTVTLLCSTSGKGMVIGKNLTIDFGGYTYSFTEGVGSTGTASNGLQILAGNEVNLKNGTLEVAAEAADKFYILVQNYADLTVIDTTLDGTNLDKWAFTDGDSYTLSNNSGAVNILGATNIIANNDGDLAFAFDVCDSKYYASKPVVNVNTTGTITGAIEVSATISENLNILGGTFTVALEKAWCAAGFLPVRNGDVYTVIEIGDNVAFNEAAGELYENLQAALQAAESTGATVQLIADVKDFSIIVPAGVTLDLNGHVAELTYITAAGKIVDSLGGGLVRTAKGQAILLNQDAMPVWNGTDGYLFLSDIKLNNETYTVYQFNQTDAGLELVFMPWLAKELRGVFADGAADNGISLKLRLTWNGVNGPMSMDVNYKDAFVEDVYDDCAQAFNLTISNASQLEGLSFAIVLVSDTGAEFTSQTIYAN